MCRLSLLAFLSGRLDRGWAARMGPVRSTVAAKLLPPDHLVAGDLIRF